MSHVLDFTDVVALNHKKDERFTFLSCSVKRAKVIKMVTWYDTAEFTV
jgi:hypothetical protein